MCCGALQCVAGYCSVLRRAAVCYSVLQCVAFFYSVHPNIAIPPAQLCVLVYVCVLCVCFRVGGCGLMWVYSMCVHQSRGLSCERECFSNLCASLTCYTIEFPQSETAHQMKFLVGHNSTKLTCSLTTRYHEVGCRPYKRLSHTLTHIHTHTYTHTHTHTHTHLTGSIAFCVRRRKRIISQLPVSRPLLFLEMLFEMLFVLKCYLFACHLLNRFVKKNWIIFVTKKNFFFFEFNLSKW